MSHPVAEERPVEHGDALNLVRTIVADVNADPRYLACFTTTQSEIVVPIFADGQVVGEIDIDGSDLAAYDQTDANFLEEIAALLAPLRPRADA